jgi:hypothetical protein
MLINGEKLRILRGASLPVYGDLSFLEMLRKTLKHIKEIRDGNLQNKG